MIGLRRTINGTFSAGRAPVKAIWRNNGLSLALFGLFALCQVGLSLVGHANYNDQRREHGEPALAYLDYLGSASFLEATMENWESEFLQMFAYVLLTAYLFQKGSAESKSPDEPAFSEGNTSATGNPRDRPWPQRHGGFLLKLYENSLSLAFLFLFLLAFALHAVGGARQYNEEQLAHGGATVSTLGYLATNQFWFESLQNWQSEFFSIGLMVVLTIFLRQRGSPESKPVAMPHRENP